MGEKTVTLGDVRSAKTHLAADELCQRGNEELVFCRVCGTYLHCKPDEEGPWLKRDEEGPWLKRDEEGPWLKRDEEGPWLKRDEEGPWLKRDEEGPWLKRSGEANAVSGDQESTTAIRGSASSWVQLKGWVDGLPI